MEMGETDENFSSKSQVCWLRWVVGRASLTSRVQVLNLFTIDVDRWVFPVPVVKVKLRSARFSVADFSIWCFSIVDAPAEIIIGTCLFPRNERIRTPLSRVPFQISCIIYSDTRPLSGSASRCSFSRSTTTPRPHSLTSRTSW